MGSNLSVVTYYVNPEQVTESLCALDVKSNGNYIKIVQYLLLLYSYSQS